MKRGRGRVGRRRRRTRGRRIGSSMRIFSLKRIRTTKGGLFGRKRRRRGRGRVTFLFDLGFVVMVVVLVGGRRGVGVGGGRFFLSF